MTTIDPNTLTRDQRSCLLYAESCMTDYGGLLEGNRMNQDDIHALNFFKSMGILDYGRVPARTLGNETGRKVSHWVDLNDAGWELAHKLRRIQCERSRKQSKSYQLVRAALDVRALALSPEAYEPQSDVQAAAGGITQTAVER